MTTKEITFLGKVGPESIKINLPEGDVPLFLLDGKELGNLRFSIENSDAVAIFSYNNDTKIQNVETLRNSIATVLGNLINAYAYTHGIPLTLELSKVVENEKETTLPIVANVIAERYENKAGYSNELFNLCQGNEGIFLRLGLDNLKNAMLFPHDSGFFCFRGIESIRQYFVYKFDLKPDNESNRERSWRIMAEAIGGSKKETEFLKTFANPVRHGDYREISSDERRKCFEITWDVFDRFVVYLIKEKNLDY